MGLRIGSDIPALSAQRQSRETSRLLNKSLESLSSGLRINQAADDAAGLAIAERFRSQVRQARVGINNLQQGVSLTQTADGGLNAQQDVVSRIRELAVQAGNGTLSDDQRAAIQTEIDQLTEQLDSTAESTEFNGQQVLNQDQTIELQPDGPAVDLQSSTAASLGLDSIDVTTQEGAAQALGALDDAANQISSQRATLGAQQNRLASAIETQETSAENALAAESAIRDADIALQVLARNREQILLQSSVSVIAQSNLQSQSVLSLLGS